jgi:hypothetical protein
MDSCRHWSSAVSYIRVYVYIVVVYDVRLNDFEWSRKKSLRAAFFLDIFFFIICWLGSLCM